MREGEHPFLTDRPAQSVSSDQHFDEAVTERLPGLDDEPLNLPQVCAACEQLRAMGLDDAGEYLASLVEGAAELLYDAMNRPAAQSEPQDVAGMEIALLDGIRQLEAHLASMSDGSDEARVPRVTASAALSSPRSAIPRKLARSNIVAAWRERGRRPGANLDMEMGTFFRWLEENRPELLRFRYHGSKWTLVRAWLEHAETSGHT